MRAHAKTPPIVGFLEAGVAATNQRFLDAFDQGLIELGYVLGQSVIVETRWAEDRVNRFPAMLAELQRLDSDVIVVACARTRWSSDGP